MHPRLLAWIPVGGLLIICLHWNKNFKLKKGKGRGHGWSKEAKRKRKKIAPKESKYIIIFSHYYKTTSMCEHMFKDIKWKLFKKWLIMSILPHSMVGSQLSLYLTSLDIWEGSLPLLWHCPHLTCMMHCSYFSSHFSGFFFFIFFCLLGWIII